MLGLICKIRQLRRSGSSGFALLDVILATFVLTFILTAIAEDQAETLARHEREAAADRMTRVTRAVEAYFDENHATVRAAIAGTQGIAIPVTADRSALLPSGIPATIQGAGFLPDSFQPVNQYDHSETVLVRRIVPGRFDVMIVTHGGRSLDTSTVATIAQKLGARGGFIPYPSSSVYQSGRIYGATGSWTSPITPTGGSTLSWQPAAASGGINLTPGHFAVSLGFHRGRVIQDYLYRAARPGLDRTNGFETDLHMCPRDDAGNCRDLYDGDGSLPATADFSGDDTPEIRRAGDVWFETVRNHGGAVPAKLSENVNFAGVFEHGDRIPKPSCPDYPEASKSVDGKDYDAHSEAGESPSQHARVFVAAGAIQAPSGKPLRSFAVSARDVGDFWIAEASVTVTNSTGTGFVTEDLDGDTPHEIVAYTKCSAPNRSDVRMR